MVYEDFTAYTEVDGQNCLTVAANTITATLIRNSAVDSYVYDNKGTNHFGNFEHLHSGKTLSAGADAGSYCLIWGVSDTINDLTAWANGLLLYINWREGGVARHYFRNRVGGAYVNLDSYDGSGDTRYWYTTKRNGVTLTCNIYSDSDRLVWVDTLTIEVPTTEYQYIFAISNSNNNDNDDVRQYVYDFDLQKEAGRAGDIVLDSGFTVGGDPNDMYIDTVSYGNEVFQSTFDVGDY